MESGLPYEYLLLILLGPTLFAILLFILFARWYRPSYLHRDRDRRSRHGRRVRDNDPEAIPLTPSTMSNPWSAFVSPLSSNDSFELATLSSSLLLQPSADVMAGGYGKSLTMSAQLDKYFTPLGTLRSRVMSTAISPPNLSRVEREADNRLIERTGITAWVERKVNRVIERVAAAYDGVSPLEGNRGWGTWSNENVGIKKVEVEVLGQSEEVMGNLVRVRDVGEGSGSRLLERRLSRKGGFGGKRDGVEGKAVAEKTLREVGRD
jgi:hypothetical protein